MSTLLEVKNLKKYFKTPGGMLHAVDDVSFSIEEGQTLGVVGESGCGKSTLGRMLVHLEESTGGQIIFDGEDVAHQKDSELRSFRPKISMIWRSIPSQLSKENKKFWNSYSISNVPIMCLCLRWEAALY